jgi:hypothetical protein
MALGEVNESILHDCRWISVENALTSDCPRNLRGSEKIELPAENPENLRLAMVHDFSRYVPRPLYHPCNELSRCRKAFREGMVAALRIFYRSRIYIELYFHYKLIDERKRTDFYIWHPAFVVLRHTSPDIVSRHRASFPVDNRQLRSTRVNRLLTGL